MRGNQGAAASQPAEGAPNARPSATARHPPSSQLDQALLQQSNLARELLLPTPTNTNPIHIPGGDLLHFVSLQQWVAAQLGLRLPLLNGMFVLVPSAELQPLPATLSSSNHSSSKSTQLGATIPWRLRQVSAVEAAPGADPADATVVLVGGDRVRAGAVKQGCLTELQDYEYLCCELAALQLEGQLRALQLLDVAHMAWRLQVACEASTAITELEQAQAAGAAQPHLQAVGAILRRLPPSNWISDQVMQYVELNPLVWPESPDQPWQLLSAEQHTQLLQGAAAAWQHYVQHKLAGQQPQPVTAFVPWLSLSAADAEAVADSAASLPVPGCCDTQATASEPGLPPTQLQKPPQLPQPTGSQLAPGMAGPVAGEQCSMSRSPSVVSTAALAAPCTPPFAGSGRSVPAAACAPQQQQQPAPPAPAAAAVAAQCLLTPDDAGSNAIVAAEPLVLGPPPQLTTPAAAVGPAAGQQQCSSKEPSAGAAAECGADHAAAQTDTVCVGRSSSFCQAEPAANAERSGSSSKGPHPGAAAAADLPHALAAADAADAPAAAQAVTVAPAGAPGEGSAAAAIAAAAAATAAAASAAAALVDGPAGRAAAAADEDLRPSKRPRADSAGVAEAAGSAKAAGTGADPQTQGSMGVVVPSAQQEEQQQQHEQHEQEQQQQQQQHKDPQDLGEPQGLSKDLEEGEVTAEAPAPSSRPQQHKQATPRSKPSSKDAGDAACSGKGRPTSSLDVCPKHTRGSWAANSSGSTRPSSERLAPPAAAAAAAAADKQPDSSKAPAEQLAGHGQGSSRHKSSSSKGRREASPAGRRPGGAADAAAVDERSSKRKRTDGAAASGSEARATTGGRVGRDENAAASEQQRRLHPADAQDQPSKRQAVEAEQQRRHSQQGQRQRGAAGADDSRGQRFTGRTQQQRDGPEDPIAAAEQAWLQELAMLLPVGHEPVPLSMLWEQLPVPKCVIKAHGSMAGFMRSQQGLVRWAGAFNHFVLEPAAHRSLRAAAGAAAGAAEAAQAAGQRWLEELALLLPLTLPPASVALAEVRRSLPVPACVVEQYGGVFRFLRSVPGLVYWEQPHLTVSLKPELHALLRARAAAARLPQGRGLFMPMCPQLSYLA